MLTLKVGLGTTWVKVTVWPLVLVEKEVEVMKAGAGSVGVVRVRVSVLEGLFLAEYN